MTKLIAAGHSHGGITTMLLGAKDKRVKACCADDPFMIAAGPNTDIGTELNLKKPFLGLESEYFGNIMPIDMFGRRQDIIDLNT